jgi:hypothetical protein
VAKRVTLKNLSQHDRISELLRLLGYDAITTEEFWLKMREYGLDDDDIDAFCRGEHVE